MPSLDLESIDVTLEQSLMRSGDEEVVRWTASTDTDDQEAKVAADTPAEALRMLADEIGGRRPTEARLEEMSQEIRDRDSLGEASWWGDLGYHTFFNPNRTDYGIGMTTATTIAFQETIEELWLEADIVEDSHGEVTPETVAAEAESQLDQFIGQFRFFELYAENLEEVLRDAREKYDGVGWS